MKTRALKTRPLKIRPLGRDEARSVDRIAIDEFGISGLVLMENAGCGAAQLIHTCAPDGPIVILCGKGNNAGDGYVIARHLDYLQRDVSILSIVPTHDLTGDAATNHDIAVRSGLSIAEVFDRESLSTRLSSAATIVDCLLGTGATGPLRGLFGDAVTIANQADSRRIAIDVPTGMDCDTGEVISDAFRADETITFVAPKLAMAMKSTQSYVGKVHVVSIGVPSKLLQRYQSAPPQKLGKQ